jgi:hypothetical protein
LVLGFKALSQLGHAPRDNDIGAPNETALRRERSAAARFHNAHSNYQRPVVLGLGLQIFFCNAPEDLLVQEQLAQVKEDSASERGQNIFLTVLIPFQRLNPFNGTDHWTWSYDLTICAETLPARSHRIWPAAVTREVRQGHTVSDQFSLDKLL